MKAGFKKITISVDVSAGDTCKIDGRDVKGICYFHHSQACKLFNKVIVDYQKCKKCVEACK